MGGRVHPPSVRGTLGKRKDKDNYGAEDLGRSASICVNGRANAYLHAPEKKKEERIGLALLSFFIHGCEMLHLFACESEVAEQVADVPPAARSSVIQRMLVPKVQWIIKLS